ncbi:MAG: glycosyltransferase family 39 protein [Candidatus Eisenbacteria bacterium]
MWNTRQRSLLVALFLLAVALRLLYLFDLKDYEFSNRLLLDPGSYDRKAAAILEGESPAPGRAFYQAPLYSYFLAGVYAVAGRDLDSARFLQILLGCVSVVLIARIGTLLLGFPAGLLAGAAAALHAPFPFFEAQIMKTSLGVFLVLAGVFSLLAGRGGRSALAAGLLLGLASLVRENALVLLLAAAAGSRGGGCPGAAAVAGPFSSFSEGRARSLRSRFETTRSPESGFS